MKSRELVTTPVLIVTNYQITPHATGKCLHSFTPETTGTVYQFIANQEPVLEVGQRYNIGYRVENGVNAVDVAASAKADAVDKVKSFYVAKILGEEARAVETKKSEERVVHSAKGWSVSREKICLAHLRYGDRARGIRHVPRGHKASRSSLFNRRKPIYCIQGCRP